MPSPALPASAVIADNLFPVSFMDAVDSVLVREARVFRTTGNEVFIYIAGDNRPWLWRSLTVADYERVPGRLTVTDDEGKDWTFAVMSNCGCGNPLKGWAGPWNPPQYGS